MKCLYIGNAFEQKLIENESVSDDLLSKISERQVFGLSPEIADARANPFRLPRRVDTEMRLMMLLRRYLNHFAPDIVHFDNPGFHDMDAALRTAKSAGAAVVMSLRDISAREGSDPHPNLPAAGASRRGALNIGRRAGDYIEYFKVLKAKAIGQCLTRSQHADRYIAPSYDFQAWLTAAGMDPDKIAVMPAVVMPRAARAFRKPRMPFALFAGDLTADSGIRTVLDAWKLNDALGLRLVVAGDGPLTPEVETSGAKILHLAGRKNLRQLDHLMRRASCFLASSGAEQAHMIARALANGLPVIAADTRAAMEMIDSGRTGYLFRDGDPMFLAAAIRHAFESHEALELMGAAAAEEFRRRFSPWILRRRLAGIYRETIEISRGR